MRLWIGEKVKPQTRTWHNSRQIAQLPIDDKQKKKELDVKPQQNHFVASTLYSNTYAELIINEFFESKYLKC